MSAAYQTPIIGDPGLPGATSSHSPTQDGALTRDLSHLITQHLNKITHPSSLPAHDCLEVLGLDSIGAVQLAEQLQSQFGLEVHPDELFGTSLGELASHVRATSFAQNLSLKRTTEGQSESKDQYPLGDEPKVTSPTTANERKGHGDHEESDWLPPGGGKGKRTIHEASPSVSRQSKASASKGQPASGSSNATDQACSTSGSVLDAFNPLDALAQSNSAYSSAAKLHGFNGYWETTAPLQSDIVVAYITEALASLGCDLSEQPNGVEVPPVAHLGKYDRLMSRLWGILEKRYIVQQRKGKILRGSDRIDVGPSEELIQRLRTNHPSYECEAKLLELVGPRLADCLPGRMDPIKVLFGSADSRDIMATFYARSPMMATHMEQVLAFCHSLVHGSARHSPLKILEVGAGTGGTTARLVDALTKWMAADNTINVQYTFTDLGPSFVTKARQRWRSTPFMSFSVFDIEQEIPETLRGQFDIVLGSNVVHATTDRTATCRRLRQTLKPHGILVLSEVTKCIDWYDICFGLLDGWWLSDGGKGYAIQPASVWMNVFARAGFERTGHSGGDSEEANTQQLLVAQRGSS